MPDELPTALQESVLAVLAFDRDFGAQVVAQVKAEHFDEPFQLIATTLLDYWRQYSRPPGRTHLDDVFGFALQQGERSSRLRRILLGIVDLEVGLNSQYVVSRLGNFIRAQTLKVALMQAGEMYRGGGADNIDEIEGLLYKALRTRNLEMDAGTFLNDPARALRFLDTRSSGYLLGIPELDSLDISAAAGELLLYVGPKGCLVGDTLIDCPRDLVKHPKGIPIRELVGKQFLTYSWDFELNKPCLSRVLDVWRAGNKPVYRVKLHTRLRQRVGTRRGGTVRARYLPPMELVGTYDHPVLLSDGSWVKLGELQPGASLKSLYRRATSGDADGTSKGNSLVNWTGVGHADVISEHRFVCEAAHGAALAQDMHVHHKDHNPLNQSPDNLMWMTRSAHFSYHTRLRNLEGTAGWLVTGIHPRGMLGKTHNAKTRKIQSVTSKARAKTRLRSASGTFLPNHKVVSIKYVGVRTVYDMEVERTNNFVANGVFVHNSGKSWFCIHMGKQGLLQRGRVAHVSLEMDEEWVLSRYMQTMFGAARRPGPIDVSIFEFDDLNRLIGWDRQERRPRLAFSDPRARQLLREKMRPWGLRLGQLVVKRFPTGGLTVTQLEGWLDYMEVTHSFIPTMLIVDYPDLMALGDPRHQRIELGRTIVNLRGLAIRRNLALVAPTQGGRKSLDARRVRGKHTAEDISKIFTADNVLTYSRTPAEKRLGLARLYLEYARNTDDDLEVVITQAYAMGQYVLSSTRMVSSGMYWDKLKATDDDTGEEEPDE